MTCMTCRFWQQDQEHHVLGACPELLGMILAETDDSAGVNVKMMYTPDNFGCVRHIEKEA